MRVCLITSASLPPEEGLGYHVSNLAQHLARQGHKVDIVTRGGAGPGTQARLGEVTVWRLPFIRTYPFHVHVHGLFVDRWLRQREGQFDVVNEHSPLPPAIRNSVPLVTTVHSPMKADTAATPGADLRALLVRLQTPISQRIERSLFDRSQRVTVVAKWVAEALAAYGLDAGSVVVTGNGVEPAFLAAPFCERREPFILYVGRLEPGKGLEELIAAAAIVLARRPNAQLRFVVAGQGSLLPRLRTLVSQAGLGDRFEFRGQISADRRGELVQLYQSTAAFVLPSHHEGMPTVLLEAMATGAPVVSTAVGGALEVMEDGVNGLMVAPRQPEALAAALINLLEAPQLGAELGLRARHTVERRYSWEAVAGRYLDCYQQAVHEPGTRA